MRTKQTKGNRTKGDQTKPSPAKPKRCSLGFGAFPVPLKHVPWPTNSVWVQFSRRDGWRTVLYAKGPGERQETLPACPESRAERGERPPQAPAAALRWPAPSAAAPGLRSRVQRPASSAAQAVSEQEPEAPSELLKQQTPGSMGRRPCPRAPPAGQPRNRQASACCLCIYSWWEG